MSKLNDYFAKEKIDPRRVLIASKKEENLQDEDRAIVLARKVVAKGKPTDADKERAEKARRSGRPVSNPTLSRALRGDKISGAARTRITRAVNRILTQRKKPAVASTDLF